MNVCSPICPYSLVSAGLIWQRNGPVMLSGYESDLYNDTLKGWAKLHHKARSECGGARTETLWLNYEPQMTLL